MCSSILLFTTLRHHNGTLRVHWWLLSPGSLVPGGGVVVDVGLVEAEHLLEALPEVGEETVEEGVGAGVDVGEDDQEEVQGLVGFGDDVNQVDNVCCEEGQPA